MPNDYELVAPPVGMIQQINNATCWLASCRMMYKWKNPSYKPVFDEVDDPELNNRPQDEVLRKLYDKAQSDSTVDLSTWMLDGIAPTDAIPLARAMGLRWGGGGKLEAWQFADAIKRWGPLLAIGGWNTRSHVLLVTGAEKTDDTGTDTVHRLLLNNPWPGGMQKATVNWYNNGMGIWTNVSGQNMHW
jgi:hypothetical protein